MHEALLASIAPRVPVACAALVAAVVIGGAAPSVARAQPRTMGHRDIRVGVNALAQVATPGLAQSITLTKSVEPAPVSIASARGTIPGFDVSADMHGWRMVRAAIGLSYASASDDVDVRAQIPHPFYFAQPRAISGRVPGVSHSELATHLGGGVRFTRRGIDLFPTAGLSIVRVSQDLVSDVTHADTYPYDEARFVGASTVKVSATRAGYHAGVDLTWRRSPLWGMGAVVRYVHAGVPLSVGGREAGTRDVGGLQAGGGVRFRF